MKKIEVKFAEEIKVNSTIKTMDDESSEAQWRRLALQFDGHRMQALWHLKCLLKDPEAHRGDAEKFLSTPPLSGEKVLEERIKAIAADKNVVDS